MRQNNAVKETRGDMIGPGQVSDDGSFWIASSHVKNIARDDALTSKLARIGVVSDL